MEWGIISKDTFNTTLTLIVNEASYQFSQNTDIDDNTRRLREIVRNAFMDIKTVKVKSDFNVRKDDTQLDINSNLDKAFSQAMKSVMGKELQKMQASIQEKVDAKIEPYKKKLVDQLDNINKDLNNYLKRYEDKIDLQERSIESKKKELEKEINKQGKKLLKDLF